MTGMEMESLSLDAVAVRLNQMRCTLASGTATRQTSCDDRAGRPRRLERRMQQLDNKEANGFTVSHDSEQMEHTPHRSARGQSVRHIYPRRLRALSGSPSRDRDPGTVTPRLAAARSAASAGDSVW